MADLSDVENAFVSSIANVIFPNISYSPYSIVESPITSTNIRLMRGWPIDDQLKNDLLANVTNITVFSSPGVAKNNTRSLRNSAIWTTAQATPTMTATLSGSNVTFAGTASTSEVIGIGLKTPGNQRGYSMRLTAGLTPTQAATTFANNIAGSTSVGPVLTLTAPNNEIVVQVGGDVTTLMEVHRNDQQIMVVVWSPTVALRDQLCSIIDPNLSYINHLYFPEGSVSGPIRNAGTFTDDCVGKTFMWKRTLFYMVEYPVMYTQIYPIMSLGIETVNSNLIEID
jgi:hypothetical protein